MEEDVSYFFCECRLSVEVGNGILNWVGVSSAYHNKGLENFTQFFWLPVV